MRKSIERTPRFDIESGEGSDRAGSSSSSRGPSRGSGFFSGILENFSRGTPQTHAVSQARSAFEALASSIKIDIRKNTWPGEHLHSKFRYKFDGNTIDNIVNAINQGNEFFSNFSGSDYNSCVKIYAAARIIVCGANPSLDSRIATRINGIVWGLVDMLEKVPTSQTPIRQNEVNALLKETLLLLRGVGNWPLLTLENNQNEPANQLRELVSGKAIAEKLVGIAIKHGQTCMEEFLAHGVGHPSGAFSGHFYLSYMLMHFHPAAHNLTVEDFNTGATLSQASQPHSGRLATADVVGRLLIASISKGCDRVSDRVIYYKLANTVLAAHGSSCKEFGKLQNSYNYPHTTDHLRNLHISSLDSTVWH